MILKHSYEKPWLVLIHGLGVSERIWSAPSEEKIKFISFKTLLKQEKDAVSFVDRCDGQYNIASWTQAPFGVIDDAAAELKDLINNIESKEFVFIAHSRGGLVARRAIQRYGLRPRALICLATPHYGSRLADCVIKYMPLINMAVPTIEQNRASINELRTNAGFTLDINKPENFEHERHVPCFDICGDSPRYFDWGPINIIGSAQSFFGSRVIDEWRDGAGDGFVSIKSAKSPVTLEKHFYLLPVNHANILVNRTVFDTVSNILAKC
ncbi:MAG: alpha/beta hydrolase [Proteobacteria bacterium]|nr:alpha/beta hydrolase [Pseudomonadota bacterium]